MADGAAPTISPKEAIALGGQYFKDLMGGHATLRVLLEGLSIDDASGNWVVTIGFDSERVKPRRILPNMFSSLGGLAQAGGEVGGQIQDYELVREFRAVHISSADGSFVKLEHA